MLFNDRRHLLPALSQSDCNVAAAAAPSSKRIT
jgi:hypothetical protein